MQSKKPAETQQCRHDKMMREADGFLAEIDKVLGENTWMNLDGYEDPEANDWVLPYVPSPASVPDNTSCFGPLYFWRGVANPAQARVSVAVTREITPPWRRGLGVTVRSSHAKGLKAYAVGIWWPGKAPQILTGPPVEANWEYVVERSGELRKRKF